MKVIKFYLKYFKDKYKLKRVQAQIVDDYDMLKRFAERLGFVYEGTLHNYCGGDLDNCMYAIWDHK
jgi:RimJ/RimL family protein N-acetyltransferase